MHREFAANPVAGLTGGHTMMTAERAAEVLFIQPGDTGYEEFEFDRSEYSRCRGGCGTLLPNDQRRHHRGMCVSCRTACARAADNMVLTGPSDRAAGAVRAAPSQVA